MNTTIINCDGCKNHCPLSSPKCAKGRDKAEAVDNGTYVLDNIETKDSTHVESDNHSESSKPTRQERQVGRKKRGRHGRFLAESMD